MKRSTRVFSIFLATTMTFTALSACSLFKNKDDGINRVTVILPEPTEEEEIVNITSAVTINSYLTARAYLDLILEYDTENMTEAEAEEFVKLIDDATVMFENTELLSYEMSDAVDAWEESGAEREEAVIKELAISPMDVLSFSQNVYAAKKSPAEEWAQEVVDTFDNAQPGKGLRTLAEQMGTDAKYAYAQLKQAQAILEGAAYMDVADKAGQIVTGLKTLKAAGTAASFVIAVTAAPASVGLVETGGILCTGVSAVAQVGSLSSQFYYGTEDNYVSAKFDDLDDKASKLGTVFGFIGLSGAVTDIGKAGKSILSSGWSNLSDSAKTSFINNSLGVVSLGSSEVTNYLDNGTILGGAVKITDDGVEVTFMDTKTGKKDEDTERAKKMITELGLDKADVKTIMEEDDDQELSDTLPEDVAKQIIEDNEPLTPDGGFDVEGFIKGVSVELDLDTTFGESEVMPAESSEEITEETTEETTEDTVEETTAATTQTSAGSTGEYDAYFDSIELNSVDNWILFLEGSWYGDVPWYSYDEEGNATKGGTVPGDYDMQTMILSYSVSQECTTSGLFVYYIEGNYLMIEKIDANTIKVTESLFPDEPYILVRQ